MAELIVEYKLLVEQKLIVRYKVIVKRSGYWHPDSEQEIECKDDLSTTVAAGLRLVTEYLRMD